MIPHSFYAFFIETSSNTLSECTLVSEDQIPNSKNNLRVITFEIGLIKGYSPFSIRECDQVIKEKESGLFDKIRFDSDGFKT